MTTYIRLKCGDAFLTNDDIKDVSGKISRGELIRVWWFAAAGNRFTEDMLLTDDELAYLRTESDDG